MLSDLFINRNQRPTRWLFRDCATAAAGYQLRILGQDSGFCFCCWRPPALLAVLQFFIGDVQVQKLLLGVDGDLITLLDERDCAAYRRFRGAVSYYHSISSAGKAAVGDQAHRVAQARAHQRPRWGGHLRRSRATLWTRTQDADYIAT